jgi:hypothetical protein
MYSFNLCVGIPLLPSSSDFFLFRLCNLDTSGHLVVETAGIALRIPTNLLSNTPNAQT